MSLYNRQTLGQFFEPLYCDPLSVCSCFHILVNIRFLDSAYVVGVPLQAHEQVNL